MKMESNLVEIFLKTLPNKQENGMKLTVMVLKELK